MKAIIFLLLLLNAAVFAQEKFEIKNASQIYSVRLEVENCGLTNQCTGKAMFKIYKKHQRNYFQIIKLQNIRFNLNESKHPQQISSGNFNLVYFKDFNFDGFEDMAVQDGFNGGYGANSYQVYLFSSRNKKFVLDSAFTKLAQGQYFGLFDVDKTKKILKTFSRSGNCTHYSEEYKVINNHPEKVAMTTEDCDPEKNGVTVIETKKLIKGKWRTWIKHVKDDN